MDLNDLNTLWSGTGRQVFVATHLLHVKGLFKPEEKKYVAKNSVLAMRKARKWIAQNQNQIIFWCPSVAWFPSSPGWAKSIKAHRSVARADEAQTIDHG